MKWMHKEASSNSTLHQESVDTFQVQKLMVLKMVNSIRVTSLVIKLQVKVEYKIHLM